MDIPIFCYGNLKNADGEYEERYFGHLNNVLIQSGHEFYLEGMSN